ncbi:MAG: LCP family protein [Candidatus Moranbacteria bacterium]|nr:LCP family protein [Candidatus Moranbacteria bacterium]
MTLQNRKPNQDFGSTEFSPDGSSFDVSTPSKHLPFEHRRKKAGSLKYQVLAGLFVVALFAAVGYGSFFVYKIYSVGKKVSIEAGGDNSSFLETLKSFTGGNQLNLQGAQTGRINILLLGIAGEGKPGQFLTDTIMVASLDTKNNRVALLSIPRDLYVKIPDTQMQSKINSVYQLGLGNSRDDKASGAELIKKTINNITGIDINYYVVMNFDGFQKAIDDIGGVNVMNQRDIFDARYPGPNYSYETFQLSKGFHQLNGATALKYARVRHNDPEGDFGRAKRQQQIMQATKNKIFSAGTMLNVFAVNDLLNTLGDNIKTDISPDEISSFFELTKKLDTNNINNMVVDAWNADSLLKVSHVQMGSVAAFVLLPRVGNYSEIQDLAKNIFDLKALQRRRDEIAKEDASIVIINKSGDNKIVQKIQKVLQENLKHKNVTVLNNAERILTDKTVVYGLTGGQKPFTLDELATKLPATVSYSADASLAKILQNKEVDLALVVGKDLIDRYNGEEGTLEDLNRANDDQENAEYSK